jgi:hypothetical protein
MISSQDGTEERRPRAFFRPGRPFCSPLLPSLLPFAAAAADAVVAAGASGAGW